MTFKLTIILLVLTILALTACGSDPTPTPTPTLAPTATPCPEPSDAVALLVEAIVEHAAGRLGHEIDVEIDPELLSVFFDNASGQYAYDGQFQTSVGPLSMSLPFTAVYDAHACLLELESVELPGS